MPLPELRITLGAIAIAVGTSVAEAFELKDPSDYEVKRELLEERYPAYESFVGRMHAGLMPAALPDDKGAAHDYSSYFFWLFWPDPDDSGEEKTPESFRDDTLLLWFNGGPGCSSLVGNMGEMGPVGMEKFRPGIPAPNPASLKDAPLVPNEFAWTKKSAMLFVEQPGGTGFSTASSAWTGEEAEKRTEDDVAEAFYAFMQNLFTVFGDELSKRKVYLSGESYAGMYIPSIARGLHRRNKKVLARERGYRSPSLQIINLRGAAIGNGWIDPHIQGPTTIDFAWWHGMIDLNTYRGLQRKWEECMSDLITDTKEKPFHPFNVPDECGVSNAVMQASGSTFMYDVTTYDAYPALLDKHGAVGNFFNDPMVRESLNAPSLHEHPFWQACVPGSGRRRRRLEEDRRRNLGILLEQDKPLSVVPYIAELLDDAKIDILMYNGDLDLACSSQSTELALESMEWSGSKGWLDPETTQWKQWSVDGQPAGHTKSFDNLQFLVVYNSGHFVPTNQARNSLNMIGRLLDGESLGGEVLPSFPLLGAEPESAKPTTEDGQSAEMPSHHTRNSLPLLTALIGFLLGMLASRVAAKRAHSRQASTSTYSEVSASPNWLATETTSLRGRNGAVEP